MGNKDDYIATKIPIELVKEIQVILNNGKHGYKSLMEFVRDAVRRRLDELNKDELSPELKSVVDFVETLKKIQDGSD